MNAIEEIQAAIDALTAQMQSYIYRAPETIDPQLARAMNIVRAQLAILNESLRQAGDPLFKFPFTRYDESAIALAVAINGGV